CDNSNCFPPSKCDSQGLCSCAPLYWGVTCSLDCPPCDKTRSIRCDDGRVGSGTCICKFGWDGPLCTEEINFGVTPWTICEGSCGGTAGTRKRAVRCTNLFQATILGSDRCLGKPPPSEEVCSTPLCDCGTPPVISGADNAKAALECPVVMNGETCEVTCMTGYESYGQYNCSGSRYVQHPFCAPLGTPVR
ncbi:unnamed protein product, partial [Polarella glacialis]